MEFIFTEECLAGTMGPCLSSYTSLYPSVPELEPNHCIQAIKPGSFFQYYLPPGSSGEGHSFVLDRTSPGTPNTTSLSRLELPKSRDCPKHIPRPKNAFMLFRSHFLADAKVRNKTEGDCRHISRIIGHCWAKLSSEEKKLWHPRAERERLEHKRKYPNYKYRPVARSRPSTKRKVPWCRNTTGLLSAGKDGEELNEELIKYGSDEGYVPCTQNTPAASEVLTLPASEAADLLFPPLPLSPTQSPSVTAPASCSAIQRPLVLSPPLHLLEKRQLSLSASPDPPIILAPDPLAIYPNSLQ